MSIHAVTLESASQRIQTVLADLAKHFPTDTPIDQRIFLEQFDRATKGLHDDAAVLAHNGVESVRLLCPEAGVPPEMARKLAEILYYNSQRATDAAVQTEPAS